MKKIITTLAMATLALMSVTTGMANVLTNPGFETDAVLNAGPVGGATGWTSIGNANTTSANSDPTRTGTGSLHLVGSGGVGVPNVYQSFPASPGQIWNFQGYMRTPSALPADATFGLLKIVWRDANGVELQPGSAIIGGVNTANPGVESTPFLNSSSTPNTWIFTQAQGVAPAGAAEVRFYVLMVDQSAGTGYFDDLDATPLSFAAAITSPANLASVMANYTITATASVAPGTITNVYFYDDATLLGNDDTSPYSFNVVGASLGAHALKVIAKASTGGSTTSSVVNVTVVTDPYLFTVDPAKIVNGFMNVFELPQNSGGFQFGNSWGISDLRASYAGSTLTLAPNIIADSAGYWYVTTASPSVGNKSMDASMYAEPSPSLPGVTMTFTGTVLADTMATNGAFNGPVNPAGNGWTCVAFIKDFAPDFSSNVTVTTPLTNGTTFRISLATINDPARHVQYGFETIGPCVWATDTALAGYGNVQVGPLASTANSPTITPSLSGGNVKLSFPTQTGFVYTVQYKTNLLSSTWTTLTTTNGTGLGAVVTNSVTGASRFYRVSIQ